MLLICVGYSVFLLIQEVNDLCFKTIIGIPDSDETFKVEIVCRNVACGDDTFRFKIVKPGTPDLRKKFAKVLIIYSPDLKTANQRGGWFIHKVKDARVANYFWTKAC